MIKVALISALTALLVIPNTYSELPEPSTASGSEQVSVQEAIDEVLADHPGGTQAEWNEVAWDGGQVTLTLDPDLYEDGESTSILSAAAMASCPRGSYCAFSSTNYRGNRLAVSTCTNRSTSALSSVRSVANARTSSTVRAYNKSTRVASVSPRSGKNISSKVTRMTCG